MFVQNFIKLGAAVYELSYPQPFLPNGKESENLVL